MASPAWLPPGFSPSASQPPVSISSSGVPSGGPSNPTAVFPALSGCAPASQSSSLTTNNSVQESLQTKTGFSYSPSRSANITSGTTQQSSSNAVVVSNPSTSSMVLQPPIPGMHSSTSHSFSYNISQSGSMFPGSQQFQTSMNVSGGIAHETIASSAPTTTSSISVVAQTSNFPMMSSTPNSGPSASWAPAGLAFLNPGAPRAPGTPGPPGIVQSAQLSSNFSGPSIAANSSSTIMRPGMPAGNVASNSSVPAHVRAPHPSLPAVAAPSQGFWLQPMHMGGMHRLPVMPYPATFASPFPLMGGGMPPPSTAVPGSHPPGVTSVVNTGAIPASSAASVHQLSGPSGMTMELPASDHKLSVHDVCLQDGDAVNEQLDAWTAHKTETGVVYYYNSLTGESTYNKPLGLKGELEKVSAQPKPVSMVNVARTDWVLVTTTDGKKYYYNSKTKVSSWQIPNEVTELRKKQDAENLKENATSVPNSNLVADKEAASISLNVPAFSTGGRDAMALRASGMQSSALDLVKKKLQDSGAPVTSSPVQVPSAMTVSEVNGSKAVEATSKGQPNESSKDKPNDTNGDGNVSDSSSDSEDTDSGSMKEECIIQFKEMLKERGVAPFSKWDKELPKFVFDPRFKAIPSHSTRRALFEHYVKTRMEEERKEKRAAQRAAIEGFKQLLDEASEDIDHKTDYQTFRKKWGNDPCFLALDRKDRENLLKERILPLKKAAEEKAQAIRAVAVGSFKSMLREKEDITVTSRWSRVKDSLRNDPRYKSVNHEDREVLFNEHLSELRATEEEAEQEAKAKRQEQDKLKERERELRKRKEREEQEMERVRLKVRRKEVIASFQALLVETIKDPQASWTESKAKLEKDPQGRASNSDLDSSEMEKLFRDHIRTLLERCAREYRALLAEVLTAAAAAQETEGGKTVLNSWSTAKRLLRPDPRYNKMPRKEREVLWRRYAEDMLRKQNLEVDNRGDKKLDLKSRSSADPGRSSSGLRR